MIAPLAPSRPSASRSGLFSKHRAMNTKKVVTILTSLLKKGIEMQARVEAIEAAILVLAQEIGWEQKDIISLLVEEKKISHQKLLDHVENFDPGLSAELDDRNQEDVPNDDM